MICSWVVTSRPVVGSSSTTQIGIAGQRHGDADTLLLAAGQLMRIAALEGGIGWQADQLQHVGNDRRRRVDAPGATMRLQGFPPAAVRCACRG